MALFDALTAIMLVMSSTYLPGALLILLPQAAIPISMICSKLWLKTTYRSCNYVGASIVVAGLLVVLWPLFTTGTTGEYSCIPLIQEMKEDFCAVCQNQYTEEDCTRQTTISDEDQNPTNALYYDLDFITSDLRFLEEEVPVCSWAQPVSQGSAAGENDNSQQQAQTMFWSLMVILAMIPMTLSTIYKEQYTNKNRQNGVSVDVIVMNNWITIFKAMYSVPLSVPAGYASSPSVSMSELPTNLYNGLQCFLGQGTITTGCHPDVYCATYGPLLTILFVVAFFSYSALIILLLNYASTNVLFLALTLMVPLSNLIFASPLIPTFLGGHTVMHASDVGGLLCILAGLLCYRFGGELWSRMVQLLSCGVLRPHTGPGNSPSSTLPRSSSSNHAHQSSSLLEQSRGAGVHKNDQFFYWLIEQRDEQGETNSIEDDNDGQHEDDDASFIGKER
jgi:hypothetical protein